VVGITYSSSSSRRSRPSRYFSRRPSRAAAAGTPCTGVALAALEDLFVGGRQAGASDARLRKTALTASVLNRPMDGKSRCTRGSKKECSLPFESMTI